MKDKLNDPKVPNKYWLIIISTQYDFTEQTRLILSEINYNVYKN